MRIRFAAVLKISGVFCPAPVPVLLRVTLEARLLQQDYFSSVLCSLIFLGCSAMDCFEIHVNFTIGKVKQLREEVIPMYQQGTHLDLPRYTCVACVSFANVQYYRT